MTWQWPWVSRLAFELAIAERDYHRARADRLDAAVLTMRRDGFTASKPATIVEPKDLETEGLARAEQALIQRRDDTVFIERAAADIQRRTNVSPAQARAEAVRIRRELQAEDPPT